jgi:hypothetical protein
MHPTTTGELLTRARHLQTDLEDLRAALEASPCRPETKSAVSRDLVESQARVDAVVRACVPLV